MPRLLQNTGALVAESSELGGLEIAECTPYEADETLERSVHDEAPPSKAQTVHRLVLDRRHDSYAAIGK